MLPPVGNVYDIPDKSTTIHGTTTSDYCSALTSGSEATNDVEDEIYSSLQDLSVARLSVQETSQLWVFFQRPAYPLCYIEKCLHVCIYSSAPFSACGYECVSNVATCTLVGQGLTIINNNERWVPGTTAVRSTFVAFRGFCTLVLCNRLWYVLHAWLNNVPVIGFFGHCKREESHSHPWKWGLFASARSNIWLQRGFLWDEGFHQLLGAHCDTSITKATNSSQNKYGA